jgi:sterol desaturase/sphingolipid hydroxylase (fatty acid hydroxylase superfamily)
MNRIIFVAFVLSFALTIWGRKLREEAFRSLLAEQRTQVADKIPNYSATEMIPFAVVILTLVWLLLFWPEWLVEVSPTLSE